MFKLLEGVLSCFPVLFEPVDQEQAPPEPDQSDAADDAEIPDEQEQAAHKGRDARFLQAGQGRGRGAFPLRVGAAVARVGDARIDEIALLAVRPSSLSPFHTGPFLTPREMLAVIEPVPSPVHIGPFRTHPQSGSRHPTRDAHTVFGEVQPNRTEGERFAEVEGHLLSNL